MKPGRNLKLFLPALLAVLCPAGMLQAQESPDGIVLEAEGRTATQAVFRWPEHKVRYYVGDIPVGMNWRDVRAEIARAIREWERRTGVEFEEIHQAGQTGTIDISFATGDHNCQQPFRGEMAHTFFPSPNPEPVAGDIHINAGTAWAIGEDPDLFSVLVHELGHALGLRHNYDDRAVMFPFYRLVSRLSVLDVDSLKTLYE